MNNLIVWQSALVISSEQDWVSTFSILPKILGAIFVFSIGLIRAYWVKKMVIEGLKLVKVSKLSKDSGIDKYLQKADIKANFVELIGTLFEWLVILIFFLAAVEILGLPVVSDVLINVIGYIPNVIAAVLILAAGYLVGGLVDGLVRGALTSVDHQIAKPAGKFARWFIIVVAVFAAVDQLQIAGALINTFFQGLTYTIVLVLGLSIGLGSKDVVGKILDDWYEKIKK